MQQASKPVVPADLLDAVSPDHLWNATAAISQWVRLSGSPEEALAFDFIEETLRGFGLEPVRYQADAYVSLPGPAALTVEGPVTKPIDCITHSFAIPTPEGGIAAPLVYAGRGLRTDYVALDLRGKFALTEGLANPEKALAAQAAGALGLININDERLHEMIVSGVWGTPTEATLARLPQVHVASIRRSDGAFLKTLLGSGSVAVRLTAAVETGWRQLPALTADLAGTDPLGRFLLFSGHVDSWHYGAMDNGSANATQLEIARLLAPLARKGALRRGLRLAFWSGHSHARYAGSAWYADAFWSELHERAIAHLNIDSPGSRGATLLTEAPAMAETYDLAAGVIKTLSGQKLAYRRMGRMGDQSFWGAGLPSLFVSLSQHPYDAAHPPVGGGTRSGGLGPWWHTRDDLLETIDRDNLARDARIYLGVVWQLLNRPVLPLDQRRAATEIRERLDEYEAQAGSRFDLSGVRALAAALEAATARLAAAAAIAEDAGDATQVERINAALMAVSRKLIPVNYTAAGPFEQDPALALPTLPGLSGLASLADLSDGDSQAGFLRVGLTRARNRIERALVEATAAIEAALA